MVCQAFSILKNTLHLDVLQTFSRKHFQHFWKISSKVLFLRPALEFSSHSKALVKIAMKNFQILSGSSYLFLFYWLRLIKIDLKGIFSIFLLLLRLSSRHEGRMSPFNIDGEPPEILLTCLFPAYSGMGKIFFGFLLCVRPSGFAQQDLY